MFVSFFDKLKNAFRETSYTTALAKYSELPNFVDLYLEVYNDKFDMFTMNKFFASVLCLVGEGFLTIEYITNDHGECVGAVFSVADEDQDNTTTSI